MVLRCFLCGNLILPMAMDYVYFIVKFAKLIVRYQSPSGVFLVVLLNGGNKKTAR